MPFFRLFLVSVVVAIVFSGCRSAPTVQTLARPTAVAVTPTLTEPIIAEGIYVSPVQYGDPEATIEQTGKYLQTFPNNQIGANLAFTANLRMPKLEAVALGNGQYQLHMRFSNATEVPLSVSLSCIYEGETRADRVIRSVEFPVNTFRDIVMDMTVDPARKLNIHASAVAMP